MVPDDGNHRGQGPRDWCEDECGPGTGTPNSAQQTHAHPGSHRLPDSREQYGEPAQTINVLFAMGFPRRRPEAGVAMRISGYRVLLSIVLLAVVGAISARTLAQSQQKAAREEASGKDVSSQKGYGTHFQTSDRCVACHNGLKTKLGEDISIGVNWRSSIMANSGRDPYWMAGVRRELIDHPNSSKLIQDECTICHMPMMRYENKLAGGTGEAFTR